MRSPVAISNGWAPVLASYSAITLFTSSMSAVAGSYSRSVVSVWDETVRVLAFRLDVRRDVGLRSSMEQQSAGRPHGRQNFRVQHGQLHRSHTGPAFCT